MTKRPIRTVAVSEQLRRPNAKDPHNLLRYCTVPKRRLENLLTSRLGRPTLPFLSSIRKTKGEAAATITFRYNIVVRTCKTLLKVLVLTLAGCLTGVLLLLGGLYLYVNTGIPDGVAVDYVKGVWGPTPTDHLGFLFDLDRIKADGINTISIGPFVPHPMMSFPYKVLTAAIIKRAHRKGLAVHLVPNCWGPGFDTSRAHPEMEEKLTRTAIEWARFAEKYKVEFYSPQNEADIVLGADGAADWAPEILPEIKKYYHGTTIFKLGLPIVPPGDKNTQYTVQLHSFGGPGGMLMGIRFPETHGWDYLMVDIFPPNQPDQQENFLTDLSQLINAANDWAGKHGNKGVMIGEFGYPREKGRIDTGITPGQVVSPEEQAQRTGEYLDTAMPQVKGIIYCGWAGTSYSMKGYPVEEVIKGKFTTLDEF